MPLLPEWGKYFLLHIKYAVFFALDCILGLKRINHIVCSWIMESLLTWKGNLCSKNFCVYNICFCCICDFSCIYCYQSSLGSQKSQKWKKNQKENNCLSSRFRIHQRISALSSVLLNWLINAFEARSGISTYHYVDMVLETGKSLNLKLRACGMFMSVSTRSYEPSWKYVCLLLKQFLFFVKCAGISHWVNLWCQQLLWSY